MKRLAVHLKDGNVEYFPGDSEFEFFRTGNCYLVYCDCCVYTFYVDDIEDCGIGYEYY